MGRDEGDMLHNDLICNSVTLLHALTYTLAQVIRAMLARNLKVCLDLLRGVETRLVAAEGRDIPVGLQKLHARPAPCRPHVSKLQRR